MSYDLGRKTPRTRVEPSRSLSLTTLEQDIDYRLKTTDPIYGNLYTIYRNMNILYRNPNGIQETEQGQTAPRGVGSGKPFEILRPGEWSGGGYPPNPRILRASCSTSDNLYYVNLQVIESKRVDNIGRDLGASIGRKRERDRAGVSTRPRVTRAQSTRGTVAPPAASVWRCSLPHNSANKLR